MIASMINSFEINREKLSKNRYLASVNVTFNQRAVQNYMSRFAASNIAATPNMSGPSQSPQTVANQGQTSQQPYQTPSSAYTGYQAQQSQQSPRSSYESVTQATVRVDIADIRQWINIKKTLESIYSIQNVDVEQISSRSAVVNLTHRGSVNELQNALMGRGMQLYSNTDETRNLVPYILLSRG
jgi:hypothetical protein